MRHSKLRIVTVILVGVTLGVGAFTFHYAEGTAYMSDDPSACLNCHPTDENALLARACSPNASISRVKERRSSPRVHGSRRTNDSLDARSTHGEYMNASHTVCGLEVFSE